MIWKRHPLWVFPIAYTCVWVVTGIISYFLWGPSLHPASRAGYWLAYLLPLALIEIVSFWSLRSGDLSRPVQVSFIAILVLVSLNAIFFHVPLKNYGDNGYLSRMVELGIAFPRWMIGASILKTTFALLQTLNVEKIVPITITADLFIRLSASGVMVLGSVLLLKRFPNRLMVLLPLSTPIWWLLTSGYNEYYPFITPIYIFILVLLFAGPLEKVPPILMGLFVSTIGLAYAGFLPYCLLALFFYAYRAGVKAAVQACLFSLFWAILLVLIFYPPTKAGFLADYQNALNLGDKNSPESELGKAVTATPFYKVQFALSPENITRQFFLLFWGGGISSLIILIGSLVLHYKEHPHGFLKRFFFPGIFLAYEIFFLFFKIPKLGLLDIDLYFHVYLTIAFMAGNLVDEMTGQFHLEKQVFWRTCVFSLVLGNTGFAAFHLIFLGIPMLK